MGCPGGDGSFFRGFRCVGSLNFSFGGDVTRGSGYFNIILHTLILF